MCRSMSILVSLILLLGVLATGTANAEPIGWYRLDDGSGTTATDSSSYGNDGTLQGSPQWVDGIIGSGALSLGGSDWVAIDGIADDLTDNNFSVSAWIKTTMQGDGNVIGANDTGSGHDFIFGVGGTGALLVEADSVNEYPPVINDDEWHFIAYVRNGTTAYAYTDGVLVGTETPSGSPASCISRAISSDADGSTVDGLSTKVLPHAMALANIHIGTIAGKLNGVMPAHTPTAWRKV